MKKFLVLHRAEVSDNEIALMLDQSRDHVWVLTLRCRRLREMPPHIKEWPLAGYDPGPRRWFYYSFDSVDHRALVTLFLLEPWLRAAMARALDKAEHYALRLLIGMIAADMRRAFVRPSMAGVLDALLAWARAQGWPPFARAYDVLTHSVDQETMIDTFVCECDKEARARDVDANNTDEKHA